MHQTHDGAPEDRRARALAAQTVDQAHPASIRAELVRDLARTLAAYDRASASRDYDAMAKAEHRAAAYRRALAAGAR